MLVQVKSIFLTSNKSRFAWNSNKRQPQCGQRISYRGRNLNCKLERCSPVTTPHHTSPVTTQTDPQAEDWEPPGLLLSPNDGFCQIMKENKSQSLARRPPALNQLDCHRRHLSGRKLSAYKMIPPSLSGLFAQLLLDWCWSVTRLSTVTGKTSPDKKCMAAKLSLISLFFTILLFLWLVFRPSTSIGEKMQDFELFLQCITIFNSISQCAMQYHNVQSAMQYHDRDKEKFSACKFLSALVTHIDDLLSIFGFLWWSSIYEHPGYKEI